MSKILLAESERDLSLSIKRYLCLYNVDVLIVNDGVQALNEFSNDAFDVVIIDDNLSRINTKEVIRRIKEKSKLFKQKKRQCLSERAESVNFASGTRTNL